MSADDDADDPPPFLPGMAVGDLSARLTRLDKERGEGDVSDDRVAETLAGRSFSEFVKERRDSAHEIRRPPVISVHTAKRGVGSLGLLTVLVVIDATTGDGWWSQWIVLGVLSIAALWYVSRSRRRRH